METLIKFKKTLPEAVIPYKHDTDAGLDVVVIKKIKEDKYGTIVYDTGIQVQTECGYYTELVGRSSLIKKGWQLANCVGIIDEDYRGNLLVCLTKLHPDAEELELPNRVCQLLVRKRIMYDIEEVGHLSETARGSGGFGSTGM